MLLSETIRQQCIAYRTREGYVNYSVRVNVSDFGCAEQKFPPTVTVWVS